MRNGVWGVAAVLLLVAGAAPAAAQQAEVRGSVSSTEGPVAFATVTVQGAQRGVLTDERGRFVLRGLEPGRHVLRAAAQGYAARERVMDLAAGETAELQFLLPIRAVAEDPIVVTGTRRETRVSDSPVKVEVVSARVLQRNPTSSLADAIGTVNGLYQQIDCGVCYTSNIRINGLEGPYTAVLIDGAPIMGALASVYGLDGIDPALIEQVEVIKGPASTLYGSEAMAGVINVITKDPRFAPRLSVDAFRSTHGEINVDVAVAPAVGEANLLVSGSLFRMQRFVDENGDRFSDLPQQDRLSLFAKGSVLRDGRPLLDVLGKAYREERWGAVRGWTPADRGSSDVYGEWIRTGRWEMVGRLRAPGAPDALHLDFSLSRHEQHSYYGDTRYHADQSMAYATLQWAPPAGELHQPLLGVSVRHEGYDDNTPATPLRDWRTVPGVFAQDEAALGERMTLLGGLRLDHHGEHGLITSPRLSVKWEPTTATTLRANGGTGFRVVHLFTEDHAALSGTREVVIEEDLRPERSWNLALNLNQVRSTPRGALTVDLDAFYTRFSNKILPDYDSDPDRILYRNLDGRSVSRGLAASVAHTSEALSLSAGGTWMDVYTEREGVREPVLYAPELQGVWNAAWSLPVWEGPDGCAGLTLDYSGRVTGPMRLPEYPAPFTRPTHSEWYTIQHVKATRHLHVAGGEVDAYLAVQNLFDYSQPSPLIDPEHPFGPHFDTAYVYAPMQGRRLVIGARYGLGR